MAEVLPSSGPATSVAKHGSDDPPHRTAAVCCARRRAYSTTIRIRILRDMQTQPFFLKCGKNRTDIACKNKCKAQRSADWLVQVWKSASSHVFYVTFIGF